MLREETISSHNGGEVKVQGHLNLLIESASNHRLLSRAELPSAMPTTRKRSFMMQDILDDVTPPKSRHSGEHEAAVSAFTSIGETTSPTTSRLAALTLPAIPKYPYIYRTPTLLDANSDGLTTPRSSSTCVDTTSAEATSRLVLGNSPMGVVSLLRTTPSGYAPTVGKLAHENTRTNAHQHAQSARQFHDAQLATPSHQPQTTPILSSPFAAVHMPTGIESLLPSPHYKELSAPGIEVPGAEHMMSLQHLYWQSAYLNHPNFVPGGLHKRKGGQVRFTNDQTIDLEDRFARKKYLSPVERKQIANRLRLTERQIKTWFQNRRAKWRRLKEENAEKRATHDIGSTCSDSSDSDVDVLIT